MLNKEKLENFHKKHYKKLILIPLIILVIGFSLMLLKYETKGYLINKDISLAGGITATVYYDKDIGINDLQSKLTNDLNADISIRKLTDFATRKQLGFIVELSKKDINLNEESPKLKSALEQYLNIKLTNDNYSTEEIGPILGQSFFKEISISLILAFIFIGITVLIVYRKLIPAFSIMLSTFFDIAMTFCIVSLFDIKLSTAGIAAFLMILGYSIDTDVLLSTKLIKRKEEGLLIDRIIESAKTGWLMTFTTLGALIIGLIVTNSDIIKQIFTIILIGLIFDLISTWLSTTGLLRWYIERKNEA